MNNVRDQGLAIAITKIIVIVITDVMMNIDVFEKVREVLRRQIIIEARHHLDGGIENAGTDHLCEVFVAHLLQDGDHHHRTFIEVRHLRGIVEAVLGPSAHEAVAEAAAIPALDHVLEAQVVVIEDEALVVVVATVEAVPSVQMIQGLAILTRLDRHRPPLQCRLLPLSHLISMMTMTLLRTPPTMK